jgi:hypothetical protein
MAFKNAPLSEYYFLKRGNSLTIDPWRDKEVYFGADSLHRKIDNRIESDFAQPRGVPKFFVHGSYGCGKTHTLAHISYVLEKQLGTMYPTDPIYLDIAPLTAKEKFARIQGRLVDAIGLDRIKAAAEVVADANPGKDKVKAFIDSGALPFGDQALRSSQANVFRNLLFGGHQAQLSWEWLKGRKADVNEAQTLSTQKSLTEPQDFVWCLLNIGALNYVATKKKLVFLVDEAEAFRAVSNPDAQNELIHSLRLLLNNENTYVGFVFAIQLEGGQELVQEFFFRDDIRRRVDYESGYIDLNGLVSAVADSSAFMSSLLKYLVDQDKAAEVIAQEQLHVSADKFPFEDEALEQLSEYFAQNTQRALPAAIISAMSNAAIEAWRMRCESDKHQLVTREIVTQVLFQEG